MKEEGVAPQPLGHPRDRRFGAMRRTGDLPVGGSRDEPFRDLDHQLAALQVVGRREGLPRAGTPARLAQESRNALGTELGPIGPRSLEPPRRTRVSVAIRPRTERRMEPRGTHAFDGVHRPTHAPAFGKAGAAPGPAESRAFTVRRPSAPSAKEPSWDNKFAATVGCKTGCPRPSAWVKGDRHDERDLDLLLLRKRLRLRPLRVLRDGMPLPVLN